jgi:hypothetical protein
MTGPVGRNGFHFVRTYTERVPTRELKQLSNLSLSSNIPVGRKQLQGHDNSHNSQLTRKIKINCCLMELYKFIARFESQNIFHVL